jgi:ribosomal protein L3
MPGHLGVERVTTQNLRVVRTDPERGLILVEGLLGRGRLGSRSAGLAELARQRHVGGELALHRVADLGVERVTTQNLRVVRTDPERGLILVEGAVPGVAGGWIPIDRCEIDTPCDARRPPKFQRFMPPAKPLPMVVPGHLGVERVTTQNLRVVRTDPERGLILVEGAVPGS